MSRSEDKMLRRWRWIGHVLRMDNASVEARKTHNHMEENGGDGKIDVWMAMMGTSKNCCRGENNMEILCPAVM